MRETRENRLSDLTATIVARKAPTVSIYLWLDISPSETFAVCVDIDVLYLHTYVTCPTRDYTRNAYIVLSLVKLIQPMLFQDPNIASPDTHNESLILTLTPLSLQLTHDPQ